MQFSFADHLCYKPSIEVDDLLFTGKIASSFKECANYCNQSTILLENGLCFCSNTSKTDALNVIQCVISTCDTVDKRCELDTYQLSINASYAVKTVNIITEEYISTKEVTVISSDFDDGNFLFYQFSLFDTCDCTRIHCHTHKYYYECISSHA